MTASDAQPLRVLVVDDEAPARARLRTLLGDCTAPPAQVVGEAADALQALACLARTACDLVLLDIALPARSGLQLAADLQARQVALLAGATHGDAPSGGWQRSPGSVPSPSASSTVSPPAQAIALHRGRAPAIVFVTAHADHALRAFELDAADYLTKPVRRDRLQAALLRVAQRRRADAPLAEDDARPRPDLAHGDPLSGTADATMTGVGAGAGALAPGRPGDSGVIVVQDRGRLLRVPVSTVLYLKAELKYLTLRTDTHSHVLDGTLGDFEQRLGTAFCASTATRWSHGGVLALERASGAASPVDNVATATATATATAADHPDTATDGWLVTLIGTDERLPVSRRQLAAVRAALAAS